jgi:hypothetical protein
MSNVRYDPVVLAAAVRKTRHMAELLHQLGVENTPRVRRNMRARLSRLGVDTSHWDPSPHRWYSDEALAAAVATSTSFAGVLRTLGVPLSGGSHTHLARRIRAAGIDTSHFLGQAHYRGRRAPRKDPWKILVVLEPGSARPKGPLLRSALTRIGVEEPCVTCGLEPEWRGAPLRLIVDHVNGDWLDNRPENLRFLCPNCHSQTPTWCRRRRRPTTIEPAERAWRNR